MMESVWLVQMSSPTTVQELVVRMALACLLGACVGWDREAQNKSAGPRTHMLVSLGSAIFTIAAFQMFEVTNADGTGRGDPTRLLQGLVSGIGFLGAGQIIQSRGEIVTGITTAAGIWVVGGIGVACGGGAYMLAALSVFFVLIILRGLVFVERRFVSDDAPRKARKGG